jgi:hypothetical protein
LSKRIRHQAVFGNIACKLKIVKMNKMLNGLFKRKENTYNNTDLLSSEDFKPYNDYELSNVLGGGEEIRPYVPAYHFPDQAQHETNSAEHI